MCEQNGNVVPINQHRIFSDKNIYGNLALQDNTKNAIKIAVDYDETITKDPNGWTQIMQLMHKLGMKVYIVTYRNNRESSDLDYLLASDFIESVVFTARNGKKQFCENLGIYIDIWIDDNPISITHTLLGVDRNMNFMFCPDNMKTAVYSEPPNIGHSQYENERLPIPKH